MRSCAATRKSRGVRRSELWVNSLRQVVETAPR
jgi:hypothetical protein